MNLSPLFHFPLLFFLFLAACTTKFQPRPLDLTEPVRGWMILSDNEEEGLYVIENAARYNINHLQISHHRSEEHTSELQSRGHLVCRLLLEEEKEVEYGQAERD